MIGIVILNYNDWENAEKCIRSIVGTASPLTYKIYLVDNASADRMPASVQSMADQGVIAFISSHTNKGYSAGNNHGIRRALAEGCTEVMLVNPDVSFKPDALSILAGFLRNNAGVGIVGPKVLLDTGAPQEVLMGVSTGLKERYMYLLRKTPLAVFVRGFLNRFMAKGMDFHQPFQVHAVSGCCFMMSRYCAERVTPLDEAMFLYHEELVIGLRTERIGLKTMYIPMAEVSHGFGKATAKVRPFADTCMVESEIYYFRRYYDANRFLLAPLYRIRSCLFVLRLEKDRKSIGHVGRFFSKTLSAYFSKYAR